MQDKKPLRNVNARGNSVSVPVGVSGVMFQPRRSDEVILPDSRGTYICCTLKAETMPTLIAQPTRIQSAGNKPKLIDEYIGRVNTKTAAASVAHMRSPSGWREPGQTPEFDEFTIVLKGILRVEHKEGALEVAAGQAVIAHAGEWVRYSTPGAEGAEYIAVCLPAFSMETVHRDQE